MCASMGRSSVWSKFMAVVSLQSGDHLRDVFLLDFIRAAEDRQLAVVEVLSGGAVGAGRADARAGIAVFQGLRHVGARVDAHGAAVQRGDFLADLGDRKSVV